MQKKWLCWAVVTAAVLVAGSSLLWARQAGGERTYVGNENCRMCHSDQFRKWEATAHSRAFELLVAAGEEKNPECLSCHTTGFGNGGFVSAEETPALKGVTCESCHGPGSQHNGIKEGIDGSPLARTCMTCHGAGAIH